MIARLYRLRAALATWRSRPRDESWRQDVDGFVWNLRQRT